MPPNCCVAKLARRAASGSAMAVFNPTSTRTRKEYRISAARIQTLACMHWILLLLKQSGLCRIRPQVGAERRFQYQAEEDVHGCRLDYRGQRPKQSNAQNEGVQVIDLANRKAKQCTERGRTRCRPREQKSKALLETESACPDPRYRTATRNRLGPFEP